MNVNCRFTVNSMRGIVLQTVRKLEIAKQTVHNGGMLSMRIRGFETVADSATAMEDKEHTARIRQIRDCTHLCQARTSMPMICLENPSV